VWHIKDPSLLKAVSPKHGSKFAAQSPAMVTEKLLARLKTNKETHGFNFGPGNFEDMSGQILKYARYIEYRQKHPFFILVKSYCEYVVLLLGNGT
jgi:hypothetical protein